MKFDKKGNCNYCGYGTNDLREWDNGVDGKVLTCEYCFNLYDIRKIETTNLALGLRVLEKRLVKKIEGKFQFKEIEERVGSVSVTKRTMINSSKQNTESVKAEIPSYIETLSKFEDPGKALNDMMYVLKHLGRVLKGKRLPHHDQNPKGIMDILPIICSEIETVFKGEIVDEDTSGAFSSEVTRESLDALMGDPMNSEFMTTEYVKESGKITVSGDVREVIQKENIKKKIIKIDRKKSSED